MHNLNLYNLVPLERLQQSHMLHGFSSSSSADVFDRVTKVPVDTSLLVLMTRVLLAPAAQQSTRCGSFGFVL